MVMKFTILSFTITAAAYANIIFSHVPLHCHENSTKIYHGCLRGQHCNISGEWVFHLISRTCADKFCGCVAVENVMIPVSNGLSLPKVHMRAVYSSDATCGPKFGSTICDPKSQVYKGNCCSQYGWCGDSISHCGIGCISGCMKAVLTPTVGVTPRADGLCGKTNGGATCDPKGEYGGCCSQYGYCGSSLDHCLVARGCQNGCLDGLNLNEEPSTAAEPKIEPAGTSMLALAQATVPQTVDGSCGSGYGDTVCHNWPAGNCCSMYGFCGQTTAHCGAGCQSGTCLGAPVAPAPGPSPAPPNPHGLGQFVEVGNSGVPAMHAALMPNGRVIFLDKLEDFTYLRLPNGRYAMSSEYDPQTNNAIPLAYNTNAFCAGGTFLADGRLVSLGGNGPLDWLDPTIKDGFNAIRYLTRSPTNTDFNGQSWSEPGNKLASNRWYPSAQTMPDGTIFVCSGSFNGLDPTVRANNNPTYEILSRDGISRGQNIPMAILDKNQPYYMYPLIHLLRDGNLFFFTSKSSQIFNVSSNKIVKELPDLAGDYRTYPNTGGSVLLPLSSKDNYEPDVVICGGGAYQDITSPTDASCGRINPLNANPVWEMDSMPEGRGMVEGTLLPDGTVLWLNGGNRGAQGFLLMDKPTLQALLYDPSKPKGQRWTTLATSNIPRLYHSVAVLLLDGTVMVTGSNPNEMPKLVPDQQAPFVTDFRVEIFIPPYRQGNINNFKPTQLAIPKKTVIPAGQLFPISFFAGKAAKGCKIVLHHGGFVTHSVHMGQRMIELDFQGWLHGVETQNLMVYPPPNHSVSPPGPYVLYVVVDSIPSDGQFVSVV